MRLGLFYRWSRRRWHSSCLTSSTHSFARYNLVGSFATACGALAGDGLVQGLQAHGLAPMAAYRLVMLGYALIGLLLAGPFLRLSPAVEVRRTPDLAAEGTGRWGVLGLDCSRRVVYRLAALFALDAFAGGFVL